MARTRQKVNAASTPIKSQRNACSFPNKKCAEKITRDAAEKLPERRAGQIARPPFASRKEAASRTRATAATRAILLGRRLASQRMLIFAACGSSPLCIAGTVPPARAADKIQLAQCVGQGSFQILRKRNRRGDFAVENDRIAEFQDGQAEEKSERERVKFDRAEFSIRTSFADFSRCRRKLKMQFQQADFEREGFLHVGVQQPLRLFQRLQIFQGQTRVDAAGDGFRAGNVRKSQQIFARRRVCAARRRAATIGRAAAGRRGGGDIRPRCRRPVPSPIFRANPFRPRRIFRAANGRSGIRPRAARISPSFWSSASSRR